VALSLGRQGVGSFGHWVVATTKGNSSCFVDGLSDRADLDSRLETCETHQTCENLEVFEVSPTARCPKRTDPNEAKAKGAEPSRRLSASLR
jgi:hypothetical protein